MITYPDSERKDRRAGARGEVPVLLLNTNMIKDQVDGLLDRKTEFGGRIVFPSFLPDSVFTELTVEVKTAKGWENPKKLRNETWDLLVYDYALGIPPRHIAAEHIDWENPPRWAEEWDDNDLVIEVEEGRPFVPVSAVKPINLAEIAENLA